MMTLFNIRTIAILFICFDTFSQSKNNEIIIEVCPHYLIHRKVKPKVEKVEFKMFFDTSGALLKQTRNAIYLLGSGPFQYTMTCAYTNSLLVSKTFVSSGQSCTSEYEYVDTRLNTIKQICDNDTSQRKIIQYDYDYLGRLTEQITPEGKYTLHYDFEGRLKEQAFFLKNDLRTLTKYVYKQDTILVFNSYKFVDGESMEERAFRSGRLSFIKRKSHLWRNENETFCSIKYYDNGLVSDIEHSTMTLSHDRSFTRSYHFKMQFKSTLSPDLIDKINSQIFHADNDFLNPY